MRILEKSYSNDISNDPTNVHTVIIISGEYPATRRTKGIFHAVGPMFLARANLSRQNVVISWRTQIACTNYHVNRV